MNLQIRETELLEELKKGREQYLQLQQQSTQIMEQILRIEGALVLLRELSNEEVKEEESTPITTVTELKKKKA